MRRPLYMRASSPAPEQGDWPASITQRSENQPLLTMGREDLPASSSSSSEERAAEAKVQAKPRRTWRSAIWDTFDKSPEERAFLFKLDAAVLTFASLGYFVKYLDQANINNAFVSGMKEDLDLYGNELNYMVSAWTAGYVIGQIPSNVVLTRIRPSIWIPAMEVAWSVLTMLLSRCSTATQVYVLRFFIGLAESTFYPGMQYLIGSWYRRDELAKRSCIFQASGAIATMFSGYLMAAVYNLSDRGNLTGWQWLFVVDGIISLPIAVACFFFIPDMPENSRVWYLSAEEKAYARKRMQLEGRKPREPYTRKKVLKIVKSWHIWGLTLLYICFLNGNAGAVPVMAQFLKGSTYPRYTITQINVYPTGTYAVQIVTTLAYAWASDTFLDGRRWPPIVFGGTVNILVYVSLAVWSIPDGWKWSCYYIAGAGGGLSGLCCAWAHEICADDNEERAIVVATMNEMAYVFQAWLPLIVWQQIDAPQYQTGYITASCLSALLIVTAFALRTAHRRQNRRQQSVYEGYDDRRRLGSETVDVESPTAVTEIGKS